MTLNRTTRTRRAAPQYVWRATGESGSDFFEAPTKSDARAAYKQRHKLRRVPVGVIFENVGKV